MGLVADRYLLRRTGANTAFRIAQAVLADEETRHEEEDR